MYWLLARVVEQLITDHRRTESQSNARGDRLQALDIPDTIRRQPLIDENENWSGPSAGNNMIIIMMNGRLRQGRKKC